jgi:hypothetical protein
LLNISGKGCLSAYPTHEALVHVREGATMWDIPWWVALIIAWASGSAGFLLGVVLAAAAKAERDLEDIHEIDVQTGWPYADALLGDDLDRWYPSDTRRTNMASAKRERVVSWMRDDDGG